MFDHVVLMHFTAAADALFYARVEEFCERVRSSMPSVRRYAFRPNVSSRTDELEWAIISSFDSAADHELYQVSPVHQQMKAYMTPFIARIVVCDIDEAVR